MAADRAHSIIEQELAQIIAAGEREFAPDVADFAQTILDDVWRGGFDIMDLTLAFTSIALVGADAAEDIARLHAELLGVDDMSDDLADLTVHVHATFTDGHRELYTVIARLLLEAIVQ